MAVKQLTETPSIGLVEVPEVALRDQDEVDWHNISRGIPMVSKQILISNLRAGGFDAQLVDLKNGSYEEEYGEVIWGDRILRKILTGQKLTSIDPDAYDAWGVTNNFTRQREVACMTVKHLASTGKPVVVGGSDAIAMPQIYLDAGATAIVQDKSGAANWAIYDLVLGRPQREELTGVLLADGSQYRKRWPPSNPEDWPLPSLDLVKQCLGSQNSHNGIALLPHGSVFTDMGCDRKCDFCQTPTYRLGYQRMSPEKTLQWFALQKEAGARGVQSHSDQFLGRVMFKEGRQEILDIVAGLREMEIPFAWSNGLELKKATLGRGIRPDGDLTPDEELVNAVWGWDGKNGCFHCLVPAERPFVGNQSYAKLLPWEQHCTLLRTIVRAGVASIGYGVIVGLPDDSHDSLLYLEEAVSKLYQELKQINPELYFKVRPFAISPFPGTPQDQNIRQAGLLAFEDPVIIGGLWTPCANTHHMSYVEVGEWQARLKKIGDEYHDSTPYWDKIEKTGKEAIAVK